MLPPEEYASASSGYSANPRFPATRLAPCPTGTPDYHRFPATRLAPCPRVPQTTPDSRLPDCPPAHGYSRLPQIPGYPTDPPAHGYPKTTPDSPLPEEPFCVFNSNELKSSRATSERQGWVRLSDNGERAPPWQTARCGCRSEHALCSQRRSRCTELLHIAADAA